MPQSTFAAEATQFIDGADTDYALPGVWNLGVDFVGTSKSMVRRCLAGFDVFGAAASGRPLRTDDTIAAAELVLEVIGFVGPSGWGATVERITRADWDYLAADWVRYRVGANWTTGGGDVGTPPAAVGFASPSALGPQVVAGMAAFVTDAIASRAGKVRLRIKADDEVPAQSQWAAYAASLSSSLRPRLRVTYSAAEPAAVSESHAVSLRGDRGEVAARAEQEAGSTGLNYSTPSRSSTPNSRW